MGDGVLAGLISLSTYSEVCSLNTTYLLICLQNCGSKNPKESKALLKVSSFICLQRGAISGSLPAVCWHVGGCWSLPDLHPRTLSSPGRCRVLSRSQLCNITQTYHTLVLVQEMKTIMILGFILGITLSRRVPQGRSLLFLGIVLLLGTITLHAGLQWLGIKLSW